METIIKMTFGSKLYGTDTTESDTDYKGIILPSIEDCVLNRIPKSINTTTGQNNSKNTKDDIDEEYYSIQYFMKLAAKGEMIVIDMLHAPTNMILENSEVWYDLYKNRAKFYTKNLTGYMGYIKKQIAKYGVKGSRLAAIKNVITFLKDNAVSEDKLDNWWDTLPITDYTKFVSVSKKQQNGMEQFYEICGKKFGSTVRVVHIIPIIQQMYDNYGARAKLAEKNEGIDWKAISHAYRASEQLIEIYETGDLKYPLKNAEIIKAIKLGKYHYINDNIQGILERNLKTVEKLAKESEYPETFDTDWANKFILKIYKNI